MSNFEKTVVFGLSCLFLLSLVLRLGSYPLHMEESRRALIALEMFLGEHYFTPTLLGNSYLRKPPLHNMTIELMYYLFGFTKDWIPRIPSIIAFLFTGFFNYYFVKRIFDRKLAITSTVFYLLSVDIYMYFSRLAESDLLFSCFAYLAMISSLYYSYTKRWNLFYLIPVLFSVMAFLVKGFPGPVFWGITHILCLLVYKPALKKALIGTTISIATLILLILLYFYASAGLSPGIFKVMLGESTSRVNADWMKVITHLIVFPIDTWKNLLPFSLLLFLLKRKNFSDLNVRLVVLIALLNYGMYWIIPGARGRYVYSLFPFISIMSAIVYLNLDWEKWRNQSKWVLNSLIVALILGIITIPTYYGQFPDSITYSMSLIGFISFELLINLRKIELLTSVAGILIGVKLIIMSWFPAYINESNFDSLIEKKNAEAIFQIAGENLVYEYRAERHFLMALELTRKYGHNLNTNKLSLQPGDFILDHQDRMPLGAEFQLTEKFIYSDEILVLYQYKPNAE